MKMSADHQRPRLRPGTDDVLQDQKGPGPDERAEERSGPAEQRHDDDLTRRRPVERLDRHHRESQRVERAGQPAEERVEDEREVLDAGDVVAAGRGAIGVLADRLQHGAERRVEDALEGGHREADHHQREVVEDERAVQRQPEPEQAEGRHRDATQAVVAARPVGQMEADEVEQLGEGQREHREVDAPPPQAEETDDHAAEQGQAEPGAEGQPQRGDLELGQRDPGAVGAEPPVGGASRTTAGRCIRRAG